MKKLSQIICAFVLLLIASVAAGEYVASGQVPSIPRQKQSRSRARSSSNGNVVWGTQYDWLSTQYVTYSDIQYLDRGQVRVLKNSIYARHGYKFKDKNLRAYFNSQYWYNGYRSTIPTREFNKVEQYNIQFLARYE